MSTRLPGAKYKSVFESGRVLKGRLMSAWVLRHPNAGRKAGVVVSKKSFHDAVDRNRAKRLMREAYRLDSKTLTAFWQTICRPIAIGFSSAGRAFPDGRPGMSWQS